MFARAFFSVLFLVWQRGDADETEQKRKRKKGAQRATTENGTHAFTHTQTHTTERGHSICTRTAHTRTNGLSHVHM